MGSNDDNDKRDGVPVIGTIAAMAKVPADERDRMIERIVSRMNPDPPECEICHDTFAIVTFDDRGIARGRWCECAIRKHGAEISKAQAEMTHDFDLDEDDDEDDDTAYDFGAA